MPCGRVDQRVFVLTHFTNKELLSFSEATEVAHFRSACRQWHEQTEQTEQTEQRAERSDGKDTEIKDAARNFAGLHSLPAARVNHLTVSKHSAALGKTNAHRKKNPC